MEYNTHREMLALPEYGRNMQQLVDYVKELTDKDERNKAAASLIRLMRQVNPQVKNNEENTQRLWDHLFIMADFDLDIDSPFPPPTREEYNQKPQSLNYPTHQIRYRHYGKATQELINEAVKFDDGEEKDALIIMIANMMKKLYLNWNRESVNDEVIWDNIKELSLGQLRKPLNAELIDAGEFLRSTKKKPRNSSRKKNRKS